MAWVQASSVEDPDSYSDSSGVASSNGDDGGRSCCADADGGTVGGEGSRCDAVDAAASDARRLLIAMPTAATRASAAQTDTATATRVTPDWSSAASFASIHVLPMKSRVHVQVKVVSTSVHVAPF